MANPNMKPQDQGKPMRTGQGSGSIPAEARHWAKEPEAGGMMEKAKEAASSVAQSASEAASVAGRKAEDAAHAVGSGMQSLAGTIRENAPREGVWGTASSTVARTLDQGGRYLEQEGMSGMMDDLSGIIRRNPLPAVLVGIGIGFLLARTVSRS